MAKDRDSRYRKADKSMYNRETDHRIRHRFYNVSFIQCQHEYKNDRIQKE